jgi:hypothetical protein
VVLQFWYQSVIGCNINSLFMAQVDHPHVRGVCLRLFVSSNTEPVVPLLACEGANLDRSAHSR